MNDEITFEFQQQPECRCQRDRVFIPSIIRNELITNPTMTDDEHEVDAEVNTKPNIGQCPVSTR